MREALMHPVTYSWETFQSLLKENSFSNIQVISDHQVFALHGEPLMQFLDDARQILVAPMLFSAGEPFKSLATAETCWTHMHAMGVDRRSLVIGLGGGVVTDLSGFVASCYMRGIAAVHIPTTLMGMVDAAIGGKTAVNLPTGKNLIGTFYPPRLVLIDPHYLSTLPQREFRSGLAEVIKYGVIWDEALFEYLEKHVEEMRPETLAFILKRSCEIKTQIVQQDEKERGLRAILNYGHTFAHALETATDYATYLHGEAVAIGMCCAAHVSQELGFVDGTFVDKLSALCRHAGLPTQLPSHLNVEKFLALMAGDKKAVCGKINLVLARKIGKAELARDVDPEIVKSLFS